MQSRYHNIVYKYPEPHLAIRAEQDNIILKSRQYGQSTYEEGDMYWALTQRVGYVQKLIAFRDDTVVKLKQIIDLMHLSAIEYFEELGFYPYEHLPYIPIAQDGSVGTTHELRCATTRSRIEFITEGAKGSGRAVTVNRIYGTEYSEWQNVSSVMAGYGGSLAKDGSAIVSLDFTAQGIGNSAYTEYQEAKKNDGSSIYRAHFYGRHDFPYNEKFLAQQRKRLRKKFKQEYPGNDEEAFLKDDNAIYDPEDIIACRDDTYFCDKVPKPEDFTYSHGVDSCEGVPSGNFAVITGMEIDSHDDAYEPVHNRLTPRELAHAINKIAGQYPGIFVIESNNHGHATIQKCEDLIVQEGPLKGKRLEECLYVHEVPGKRPADWKVGWPTDADSKVRMETDLDDFLVDRSLTIVDHLARTELRQYSRLPNGKHGAPQSKSDDGAEFYDDIAIATMLKVQGLIQAHQWRKARTGKDLPVVGGTMQRD